MSTIAERLDALRAAIEAEDISYGEIVELQSLAEHIDPSDVVLREWAGVPEFTDPSDPYRNELTEEEERLIDSTAKADGMECADSPTGRHEPHPERWGDDVCVWCLEKPQADPLRCRYGDCPEGHPRSTDDEQVTCPTCRDDLGLPPLSEPEGQDRESYSDTQDRESYA